jgi:hypothetical protein
VWRTATHGEPAAAFYPRSAAQLFPLMAGMRCRVDSQLDDWLNGEGLPWLMQDEEVLDFAWGLLTLAAIKNKRDDVAQQWWERAAPSRLDSAGMCWKRLFFRDWNSVSIRLQKKG